MRRSILRFVATKYVDWVSTQLPPSGQPILHDLRARFIMLVDALPDNPDIAVDVPLDERGVKTSLDWLFASLASSNVGDSWALLAIHLMRYLSVRNSTEIVEAIVSSSQGVIFSPPGGSLP